MARRPAATVGVPALVLGIVLGLLAACGGGDRSRPEAAPTRTASAASPAPTTGSTADRSAEPAPLDRDPVELARQLDQAVATVLDPGADAESVRRAAELHQLAVRSLVLGSPSYRRTVVGALRPAAARQVRHEVHAGRLLTAITTPKRRFPPWHIVRPPAPDVLLGYYREAERRTGVPWEYLAAINLVETRMGRIRGPSTAGALGPMQFLPATWARYGAGGDINDAHDAIQAAARLLRAHGAPRDMATALWHYNPSSRYVEAVTEYARVMESSPATYRGYWHWRVLYHLQRGTYVLPVGFPRVHPVRVPGG
jgi:soluble lytic murein transglycosylase-like protein